uniref:(northern house mosquito) hypothetical protein n=1 Tax=Culex pipiens TaxID=7175 RepID=A0A8D8N7Y0_CULPI
MTSTVGFHSFSQQAFELLHWSFLASDVGLQKFHCIGQVEIRWFRSGLVALAQIFGVAVHQITPSRGPHPCRMRFASRRRCSFSRSDTGHFRRPTGSGSSGPAPTAGSPSPPR